MQQASAKGLRDLSYGRFSNSPITIGIYLPVFEELPMKLLCNTAAIASLVFVAVGFFWLWKLDMFGSDLSMCILALIAAPTLSLGCYVFQLRARMAALEKQVREGR